MKDSGTRELDFSERYVTRFRDCTDCRITTVAGIKIRELDCNTCHGTGNIIEVQDLEETILELERND